MLAGARRLAVTACMGLLAAVLLLPSSAGAYPAPGDPFQFETSFVQQDGPEVMV